jgi:class 3 adenylate cyclase
MLMTSNAGDRPFVTIVTSDLKGSTALGERLDPESLREVLTLYFDEMIAIFEGHGGNIVKIIGDAIVAVFGLPEPAEDDGLRAVQAAAESQRALASLNEVLDQRWGIQLVVRTGIASGEVNVGEDLEGQQVLTGDVMTIATAMEQNAPPLEVLIAGSTIDITGDSIETVPEGPVTPKGSDAVIASHRLVSVATAREIDDHTAGPASPSGRRVTERRKTVTIVFADPRPSTVDGGPLDPQALGRVMARYFESMRAALESHGGTVEKFIGDAVMAVYGLPVRHEDDAVRAIRASAAMQAAMPALNDRFRSEFGIELRNHIGVNTGEVITGDAELGQRLVTGDAVNTAARLEQAAGPHEIVLGALTHRLARGHVDAEPIEPLTLKGKSEPVPAFRLISIRDTAPEPGASSTPFVGRDDELDQLEMELLQVTATRSCELITVMGDAGVGKSRLIREFAHRAAAHERTQILRGRCLPYGEGKRDRFSRYGHQSA